MLVSDKKGAHARLNHSRICSLCPAGFGLADSDADSLSHPDTNPLPHSDSNTHTKADTYAQADANSGNPDSDAQTSG